MSIAITYTNEPPPNRALLDRLVFAIAATLEDRIQTHVAEQGCYCPMEPRSFRPPFGGCFSYRVNSYDGPQGQGCEIVYTYALNSEVWECRDVHGPELFRACDWRKRIPTE